MPRLSGLAALRRGLRARVERPDLIMRRGPPRGRGPIVPSGRRFVCVDFRGPDGTVHDVDYYLDASDGEAVVEDRVLHKVGEANVVPDSVRERLDRKS